MGESGRVEGGTASDNFLAFSNCRSRALCLLDSSLEGADDCLDHLAGGSHNEEAAREEAAREDRL